ncbi:MAG TPA: hypothetical protein VHM93_23220 [Candidatus Acidoferrum sp.]|jgi:hypothetical protein|nr:hypothetical protein [Candidatus Acidoferrum sp.]
MFLDKRMHLAILAFVAFAVVVLPAVSRGGDPVRLKSKKVLPNPLGSCEQPCEQLNKDGQNTNIELHSYVEEPLDQLLKRVPELKGINPAADQGELAMILRSTGAAVDEFFANVVDVIAHEEIVQERLRPTVVNGGMPGGLVDFKTRTRDSYLILRQINGSRAKIDEFRMNDKGMRIDEVGLDKGFVMTSGFALSIVHFSSIVQWDSRFLHLGDQKIGGKDTYVIAFAQMPGEARNPVTLRAEGAKVNLFVQGIAWVDKANFQIVQMRTDLLAPRPDIGLDEQTTEITFKEVRFSDLAIPLWLPRDVNINVRFTAGASVEIVRNTHRYTDYRRYQVSTKILSPN